MKFNFSLLSILLNFVYFKLYSCIAYTHEEFRITDIVKFTVASGDDEFGSFTVGLYGDTVPKTVKNFLAFVKGADIEGKHYSYKNVMFHRVIPNFMVQSGDVVYGNGTGSISIYGPKFFDENFKVKHRPYVIAMANAGPDTNGSQFYITTTQTDWLNGQHVVFGRVLHGMEVIQKIETQGTPTGLPKREIFIKDAQVIS